MAKGLRNKWRRKCKAAKRVHYGKRELEQLKKTVMNDPLYKDPNDVEMENVSTTDGTLSEGAAGGTLSDIVTVVDKKTMNVTTNEHNMEVDGKIRNFNLRTMKDQNGTYPVWMTQRRIHKKKNLKRANKKKKKKLKQMQKKNKK